MGDTMNQAQAGQSGQTNQNQTSPTGQQATQGSQAAQSSQTAPAIDYNKIQQMLEGTLAAKEDTALRAYFKQQGLSEDEMKQAIAAFKSQKAASQPDISTLQAQVTQAQEQLAQAQAAAQQAQLERAAVMSAVALGIEAKTIPYVLKMADLNQAMGKDGKINEENLKTALNKVLEDIPALKSKPAGSTGFVQVGTEKKPQANAGEAVTLKGAISEALKR